ncbi:hypothetical protein ACTMTI_49365 [Nonomuraea sp. H19]|uniref:hypothetical protein n=1 Tax=Nonomuraea sp. H19 TaxID=3452206 RepID=UPI003F8A9240
MIVEGHDHLLGRARCQGELEGPLGLGEGTIGSVGVPNGVHTVDLYRFFRSNIALRAGVAPVRRYLEPLVADVLSGALDPSPVFTTEVSLEDVATAYRRMNRREDIKALVRT